MLQTQEQAGMAWNGLKTPTASHQLDRMCWGARFLHRGYKEVSSLEWLHHVPVLFLHLEVFHWCWAVQGRGGRENVNVKKEKGKWEKNPSHFLWVLVFVAFSSAKCWKSGDCTAYRHKIWVRCWMWLLGRATCPLQYWIWKFLSSNRIRIPGSSLSYGGIET